MSSMLPELLDPLRAAEKRSVFAGELALSGFPRLQALLLDADGEAHFRLGFRREKDGRVVVLGEVDADLILRCQRCLRAMRHRVTSRICLAVVAGYDEAERLPERFDPLVVESNRIRPLDLIEDELLLGLPLIPRHEPGECVAATDWTSAPAEEPTRGRNPFAGLAALKTRPKR